MQVFTSPDSNVEDLKLFKIEVEEILQRTVVVMAEDLDSALDIAIDEYKGANIVLDANDVIENNFRVLD